MIIFAHSAQISEKLKQIRPICYRNVKIMSQSETVSATALIKSRLCPFGTLLSVFEQWTIIIELLFVPTSFRYCELWWCFYCVQSVVVWFLESILQVVVSVDVDNDIQRLRRRHWIVEHWHRPPTRAHSSQCGAPVNLTIQPSELAQRPADDSKTGACDWYRATTKSC